MNKQPQFLEKFLKSSDELDTRNSSSDDGGNKFLRTNSQIHSYRKFVKPSDELDTRIKLTV